MDLNPKHKTKILRKNTKAKTKNMKYARSRYKQIFIIMK
jgi:hypothetical protein